MSHRFRIAVIGGGVYVAALCKALAGRPELSEFELRLYARRNGRAVRIAEHCQRWLLPRRPRSSVSAHAGFAEACTGADAVVLLIRVGGLPARAHDESFPQSFGLVGDEGLGVGGFANAWRTVPVLVELAQQLRRFASSSKVFNLVAPLGITTRALLDEGLDAVGICELPSVILARLRGHRDVAFEYAGLNHLGFFWGELLKCDGTLAEADRALVAKLKAIPSPYYAKLFGQRADVGCTVGTGRARELEKFSQIIFARMVDSPGQDLAELDLRPTPWFDRALVPALCAAATNGLHAGFANVRNEGRVAHLPSEAVVELQASWSGRDVAARAPSSVPAPVERFLSRMAAAEALAYEASRTREALLLARAIDQLPQEIPRARVAALVELARTPIAPTAEAE